MNFWPLLALILGVLLALGLNLALLKFYFTKRTSMALAARDLESAYEANLKSAKIETQDLLLQQVSMELHDNVSQVLSLVRLYVSTLKVEGQDQQERVATVDQMLNNTLMDLRSLTTASYIADLDKGTLSEKIKNQLRWFISRYEIDFRVEGKEKDLNPEVSIIVVRMIQEMVRQVIKDSSIRHISILLRYSNGGLTIIIEDDGNGMDVYKETTHKKEAGLRMLHARAKLIDASVDIDNGKGRGTKVTIEIKSIH